MNNIVILCNGAFPTEPYPLFLLDSADAVVCCDGALEKLLAHNPSARPAVVIGDMDSLPVSLREQYASLVVKVEKDGPACHTGAESCFNDTVWESDERHEFSLNGLMDLIRGRKTEKKEGSYTTYLFEKGLDKILKKVGEESTEVIIAAKDRDKKETIYEIADLTYHVMVLMIEAGITLDDIHKELASRHVIDHKVKQEKMT